MDLENFGGASGGASIGFWKHWGGHGPPGPPGLTGPVIYLYLLQDSNNSQKTDFLCPKWPP